MDTRTLATSIVFAAVIVALNPAISGIAIPAPYAPYLLYQIWEIPIVAAFALISRKAAVSIAILNAAVLATFFPGALPMGAIYNLIAILATLLGIYLIQKSFKNKNSLDLKQNEDGYAKTKFVLFSTALGIILRVVIMTIVNYIVLRYPYPFGFELDELGIIASLPLVGLFNATLTLYTVPLGLIVAKAINKNLKLIKN
jgi:riboflavin transporter FmnP